MTDEPRYRANYMSRVLINMASDADALARLSKALNAGNRCAAGVVVAHQAIVQMQRDGLEGSGRKGFPGPVRPMLSHTERREYVLAKNQGMYANIAGDSPDNNPYKEGSNQFNGWADGYAEYDRCMELSV